MLKHLPESTKFSTSDARVSDNPIKDVVVTCWGMENMMSTDLNRSPLVHLLSLEVRYPHLVGQGGIATPRIELI